MGNCQTIDAAALVIQHPSGKIERLYWSVSASYVMRANPGYYVSLIMPLPKEQEGENSNNEEKKPVLFTRVKLLKPDDTLTLGHAYRLITTQGSFFVFNGLCLFSPCIFYFMFTVLLCWSAFLKICCVFWLEEVEKVMKAKKRKARGKTVEDVEMMHLEKENSACESEGMLDTGRMYQVCFF